MNLKGYFVLTAAILAISALTLSITSAPQSTEAKQAKEEKEDPQYCFRVVRASELGHVDNCAYGPSAKEICEYERAFYLNENPENEPNVTKCKKLSSYL
jgi:hypothetical protein